MKSLFISSLIASLGCIILGLLGGVKAIELAGRGVVGLEPIRKTSKTFYDLLTIIDNHQCLALLAGMGLMGAAMYFYNKGHNYG